MPRRERWAVLGEILLALEEEHRDAPGAVSITRVGTAANVPHDRLLGYLEELATAGFVTRDKPPAVTPAGREFAHRYRALRDVLDRYGLS